MAFTTPATYSVGEIVTASKLNTHIRDNIRYLKGMDGAIAFEAAASFAGIVTVEAGSTRQLSVGHTSGPHNTFIGDSTSGTFVIDVNRNPDTATFEDTGKSHARILMDCSGAASAITLNTANAANTFATERVRVTGDGKVGFGQSTPQGVLHGLGSVGRFMFYDGSGIGGSAVTIIPDGAGDVTTYLQFYGIAKCSAGANPVDGYPLTELVPNHAAGLGEISVNAGADTLRLQVATNGSVTLQRVAGSNTFSVALWLVWL